MTKLQPPRRPWSDISHMIAAPIHRPGADTRPSRIWRDASKDWVALLYNLPERWQVLAVQHVTEQSLCFPKCHWPDGRLLRSIAPWTAKPSSSSCFFPWTLKRLRPAGVIC